jgi:S-formylglutathione hydrolase
MSGTITQTSSARSFGGHQKVFRQGATERLPLLIDQGDGDPFLKEQLKPEIFQEACKAAPHPLTLRMQPGYDHSYYFIATFIRDHIEHHASALVG